MKTQESGMPPREMWESFFDVETTLRKLGLSEACDCVVDIGCGYGTFSLPAAKIIRGTVYALDIEHDMVAITTAKSSELTNFKIVQRDIVTHGSGIESGIADYVMLFNLLHAREAEQLLDEAKRMLKPGGKLGVMHWNYDPRTPRGPSMEIRLRPEQCVQLVERSGFKVSEIIDLPPYHYGFVGTR
jgi:SAM-dependent methyltransferase